MHFIDLKKQQDAIRPDLDRRIADVLAHGQYIMGPEVVELEAALASYVGVPHCITVASGTEALLISLMALGVGRGDEVITTPFTFIATAEVVALVGATPVFVDVEPETGNLDAAKLESAITPKTKAIIPVSLYGQMPDMAAINAIGERHGVAVIEDAAQSFGASFDGRRSGGMSTFGCTSFFPSKPLGCYGDGGAIFTADAALAQAAREIRVHGQSQRYVHTRIGVGGRMDTLQCAIVLAKWPRFAQEVADRERLGARYSREILRLIPGAGVIGTGSDIVATNAPVGVFQLKEGRTSVYAQYTIALQDRAAVQERFKAAGIPTAVHYPVPLSEQPAYRHWCPEAGTPVADALAHRVMSLPMGPDLSEDDQDRVVAVLAEAIKSTL